MVEVRVAVNLCLVTGSLITMEFLRLRQKVVQRVTVTVSTGGRAYGNDAGLLPMVRPDLATNTLEHVAALVS
jgi:hypothetical protein